jgi:hypothetical protein
MNDLLPSSSVIISSKKLSFDPQIEHLCGAFEGSNG